MKVELFVLCDAATDYQGKLNILGTFDSIWTKQMPAVHPLCAVALRMRFERGEEGEHAVQVGIADEEGREVVKPVEAKVNIRFHNSGLASLSTNMILNLQGLQFTHYGEYTILLSVDGSDIALLPLYVNQIPEQTKSESGR